MTKRVEYAFVKVALTSDAATKSAGDGVTALVALGWSIDWRAASSDARHVVLMLKRTVEEEPKAEPEAKPPTMTIDGVEYVEAPQPLFGNFCAGCAFEEDKRLCSRALGGGYATEAFGGRCTLRDVIYIRADDPRARVSEGLR